MSPVKKNYRLSKDGVASIYLMGDGKLGEKSFNLFKKASLLEDCGFLFPRRNLSLSSSFLAEVLDASGHKKGWDAPPTYKLKFDS